MTNEANSGVDEEAQLQVSGLQRGQMLRRDLCIQVSWFDARILSQIVDHLEGQTFAGVSGPQRERLFHGKKVRYLSRVNV